MIAAGFGCRPSCSAADICRALALALEAQGARLADVAGLFGAQLAAPPGLLEAAATLDKPLVLLPLPALALAAGGALTRSARVLERFGLPSIAETAALAGALTLARSRTPGASPDEGAGSARLLAPRLAAGAATCALARGTEET